MKQKKTSIQIFDTFFWVSVTVFGIVCGLILLLPAIITSNYIGFDFTQTGQIGDTLGGITAPFIAIAAGFLTFLAFWVQYKANEQQKADLLDQKSSSQKVNFENNFFELVKLHRDNVSEMRYTKYYRGDMLRSENRKVFREIFKEFIECYREVKKFSNSTDPSTYLNKTYQEKLEEIKKANDIRVTIIEMAIIDIAYSIVFFGMGSEGETVLKDKFKRKYNNYYIFRLMCFIKLKPKGENKTEFQLWESIKGLPLNGLHPLVEEVYLHRDHVVIPNGISLIAQQLLANRHCIKYYGGHQHRLGHYYRHLFQSYKFLYNYEFLDPNEKYFYGKILRAQLSTYEQALLLINSISALGMRWEYKFLAEPAFTNNMTGGLITSFQLIKNLPGTHFMGIKYNKFYPKINYENSEY